MRKFIFFLIVGCFIIALISRNKTAEEQKEIRVRIIPNSNSEVDLQVKQEVKDIVIYYLSKAYSTNYDEMSKRINLTYQDLEKALCSQFGHVTVSFESHTLYNKAYNNTALKNEEADTLIVKINKATGDNWWASVYPKYLSVYGSETIEYESILVNIIHKIKENS